MSADLIILVTKRRASLVRNSCEVVHQTLAPAQRRQNKSPGQRSCPVPALGWVASNKKRAICLMEITYLTLQIFNLNKKKTLIECLAAPWQKCRGGGTGGLLPKGTLKPRLRQGAAGWKVGAGGKQRCLLPAPARLPLPHTMARQHLPTPSPSLSGFYSTSHHYGSHSWKKLIETAKFCLNFTDSGILPFLRLKAGFGIRYFS